MQLRNVEIFCDVASRRSFSKAAKAHNVSQSMTSQIVHTLEEHLGTLLIDRSKRPLELTAAGELYYDGCRKLLDTYRRLEDRVRQVENNKVAGRVRVAAIYSVGLLKMDAYVRRAEELYPEVDLRVDYLHPDEVYERVQSDEATLGLVSFPRDGGEFSSISWQEQKMVLVVPAGHRLAGRKSVSSADIAGEDFVAFTSELSVRKQIDRWLKQEHAPVNIVHEFDNIENIKRAVEVGSAVAILPEPAVKREVALGLLDSVRVKDVDWRRPLGIIHRRHKTLSTAANKFVELLHEDPATFPKSGPRPESTNGHKRSKRKKTRV
ncbi:MAG: LysR family transcriptional regulator [Planctomycetaceae bacterium]|jgi:DNA-binding transcriptional LysR family regulator|nr:LysR family transcriptional regulator [Planctomycetaceae bacterium]MBT6155220.1 LysR family transcriptional regulator [Planctomycetaceae bacterium]MBT6483264.1 LysR family transcriptional regulator [Planctomycetaceae bacterium]MBT6494591.1 LysR family transcriptional regulator [Planctomycetaceae bacterium]